LPNCKSAPKRSALPCLDGFYCVFSPVFSRVFFSAIASSLTWDAVTVEKFKDRYRAPAATDVGRWCALMFGKTPLSSLQSPKESNNQYGD
jgi:hypothetical protein